LQYQNADYNTIFSSTNKAGLKQTVLGAKYLIYDPFKITRRLTYTVEANKKFNWHQLLPVVSVYAGANFIMKNNPMHFSPDAKISPKIMLITQNHLGDGSWVCYKYYCDYITTDFQAMAMQSL
jgi:hypothetical protein